MNKNITAIILAGGKSSRMGSDKGLIEIDGLPMVLHLIKLVQSVFSKVIIISNNASYNQFNIPVFEDKVKDIGPVGGILTGLENSTTNWNFVIACDLPLMNDGIIKKIIDQLGIYDAIVPTHNNRLEPLCACYNKTGLNEIIKCISEKEYKIHHILKRLKTLEVEIPDAILTEMNPFKNMNTQNDLENLKVK